MYTQPRADLYRNESQHLIMLDMPGVTAESLDIQVQDGVLTVQGTPSPPAGATLRARGWTSAPFRRSFTLGERVDLDAISASLEAGVLRLELPQLEATGPRRIQVVSS